MSKPRNFHLLDPVSGRTLAVEVVAAGGFLNLLPVGYGNPVSLDFNDGELRVLVNPDPDKEEPDIIPLKPEAEGEDS
jgi:hypothetical protein